FRGLGGSLSIMPNMADLSRNRVVYGTSTARIMAHGVVDGRRDACVRANSRCGGRVVLMYGEEHSAVPRPSGPWTKLRLSVRFQIDGFSPETGRWYISTGQSQKRASGSTSTLYPSQPTYEARVFISFGRPADPPTRRR